MMYDLDKAYSKKFFAQRKSLAWRIPIVCDAIIDVLKPKSIIDVGCGNGDLVKGFRDRGIICVGIEGTTNMWYNEFSKQISAYVQFIDLRYKNAILPTQRAFPTWREFDLAICFEVVEHIEPEYTDIFLDNLCSLSDKILFSAAGPGQGGRHHHNCQSREYWHHNFNKRNYYLVPEIIAKFRYKWDKWQNKKGIKAYYQNLMYFERSEK